MDTDKPAEEPKEKPIELTKKEKRKLRKEEEFQTWLREQKKKWKAQLEARKQRKKMFGLTSKKADSKSARYFQQQTINITRATWEIIQITETDTPGIFTIWALIGDQLHSIKLTVPRTFYINTSSDQLNGKKVALELPRSKPRQNLYEFSIEEAEYRHNSKVRSGVDGNEWRCL